MAARLTLKLNTDGRGFRAGMQKARTSVSRLRSHVSTQMGGMMKQFGAIMAVAMIAQQVKKTIEWGTRMRDLADQFGVTTTFAQKMDYAMKQTGLDAEIGFKAMKKMAIQQSLATDDLTSKLTAQVKLDAFGKLGISAQQLKTLKPEELFLQIAKNLKNANAASADLQRALQDVFGKGSSQLLVTFNADLAGMFERLQELGAVVDEDAIRRLGAVGDKMEEFKTQNRAVWADMTNFFAETWMGFVNLITSTIDTVAARMVALWDGITGLVSKIPDVIDAITSFDPAKARRVMKEMKGDMKNLAHAFGGEASAENFGAAYDSYMKDIEEGKIIPSKVTVNMAAQTVLSVDDPLSEIGRRMTGRAAAIDEGAAKIAEEKRLKAEAEGMMAHAKDMKKSQEAIDRIEEKALKRKFDQLSPEQQLWELTKKRIEAQRELNKLKEPLADMTKDERLLGLEGEKKSEMMATIQQEKLDYRTAQESVLEAMDKEEAVKKGKKDKVITSGQLSGSLKDTYTSLAKIGGTIGGKNPLLTNAEKTLKIAEEQNAHLSKIAGIQTISFGP